MVSVQYICKAKERHQRRSASGKVSNFFKAFPEKQRDCQCAVFPTTRADSSLLIRLQIRYVHQGQHHVCESFYNHWCFYISYRLLQLCKPCHIKVTQESQGSGC